MFCRVWEYDVPADSIAGFTDAYGPAGDWARLFARADGFVRTELYRNTDTPARFVTVDVWSSEAAWQAFSDRWGRSMRNSTRCSSRWLPAGHSSSRAPASSQVIPRDSQAACWTRSSSASKSATRRSTRS